MVSLDSMIAQVSRLLVSLARVAERPLTPAQRADLADAIAQAVALKEILLKLKQARTDINAETRAARQLERLNNLINRAFGMY